MPGGRPRNPRIGDTAERLAEFVLGGFAFTTPVPWQQDVGHDFHCVLIRRPESGRSLLAGPSFMVQVKNRRQTLKYTTPMQVEWIATQENPLFICFADPRTLLVQIYSTCALVPGVLHHGSRPTVLEPDIPRLRENIYLDEDGVLHVPLGAPVLSLTVDQVKTEEDLARWGLVLKQWIEIDRQNIVNRGARIHWVHWPRDNTPNMEVHLEQSFEVGFYWNLRNLPTSLSNFLRAATLFRLEVKQLADHSREDVLSNDQLEILDKTLESFWPLMGPTAQANVRISVPEHDWPAS